MRFKFIRLSCLISGLALATVVSSASHSLAQSTGGSRPLEQDAAVLTWSYDGNGYGEMKIVAVIAPIQNKVAVCGVFAITKRLSAGVKRSQLLNKSRSRTSVWVDGTQVLDGLRKLRKVAPEDLVVGTQANCVVTQQPWKSSYSNKSIELRAASMSSF